jgi:hypothetical protein
VNADLDQAFIDKIKAKVDEHPITRREAMCVALGRTITIMQEGVCELAELAAAPDCSDMARVNAGTLGLVYAGFVEEMRRDLRSFIQAEERIARIMQ